MSAENIESGYEFPIVDFHSSKEEMLSKIQHACHEYGFFNFVNYPGLTLADIRNIREIASQFFHFPSEVKRQYQLNYKRDDIYLYGYASLGIETADVANVSLTGKNTSLVDLMESFQVADITKVQNQYPTNEMKLILEEFYQKLQEIAIILLELISESLHLPSDALLHDHFGNQHRTILRITRYPALQECSSFRGRGINRISPHKDLGTITLLIQDHCGGLEVLDHSNPNNWIPVKPVEECLVINVGNILMRWTNYLYRSSIHRVITTDKSDTEERYSIIMFVNPNDDAFIAPLPGTQEENQPPKYEPFLVGDYLSCKLTQLFDPEARKDKGSCEYDD